MDVGEGEGGSVQVLRQGGGDKDRNSPAHFPGVGEEVACCLDLGDTGGGIRPLHGQCSLAKSPEDDRHSRNLDHGQDGVEACRTEFLE